MPVQMKEKSKHAGLPQQNSFGPAIVFQTLLWLLNGTAKPNNLLEKSATNMISLLFPISDWSIIMIRFRWFAISSLSPICSPSFSFDSFDGWLLRTEK